MKSSVVIFVIVSIFIRAGLVIADEKCGCHEAPAPCGPVCEPTCVNPDPKICPLYCLPNGCRCNKGYFRDGNTKKCVRLYQCTKRSTTDV